MIGRLRGILLEKHPPRLLVEAGGVGYELEAPMSTFYRLPATGSEVILHTHLVVRDDAHLLFAFASEAERSLFRSLIRVNGVGARLALTILSGMEAGDFARCVQEGDTAALTRLPGVGKKTAERLVVEMRDRLDDWQPAPAAAPGPAPAGAPDPEREAIDALVALGYRPAEAARMVSRLDIAGMASEDIIRAALKASLKG